MRSGLARLRHSHVLPKVGTKAEKLRRVWHDGQSAHMVPAVSADDVRDVPTTHQTLQPLWPDRLCDDIQRATPSGIFDLEASGVAYRATVREHCGTEPHVAKHLAHPTVKARVARLVETEQLRVASLVDVEVSDQTVRSYLLRRIEWRKGQREKGWWVDGVSAKTGTRADTASPPRPDPRTDATTPAGARAIRAVITGATTSAERGRTG